MIKFKKGFTLAEVLITLVVIGAVAAMTIPSLVNNIGDQQNKIAWKKAFADLSQATQRIAADNGGSLVGLFSDHNSMQSEYLKYLNYIKSCSYNQSLGNCWNKDGSKFLNGTSETWTNIPGVVLSNGNFVLFWHSSSSCNAISGSINRCGTIVVDINGSGQPNTIGKDIFEAHVLENTIKPLGTQGDYNSSQGTTCIFGSTAANNLGKVCAALSLYQ